MNLHCATTESRHCNIVQIFWFMAYKLCGSNGDIGPSPNLEMVALEVFVFDFFILDALSDLTVFSPKSTSRQVLSLGLVQCVYVVTLKSVEETGIKLYVEN